MELMAELGLELMPPNTPAEVLQLLGCLRVRKRGRDGILGKRSGMGKWLRKMKAPEGRGLGGDEAQTRRAEGWERQ